MVRSRGLFDTNILIDHLAGYAAARAEVDSYKERAISIVTWIEVLAGTPPDLEIRTRDALTDFTLIQMSSAIAERSVILRRQKRLKLPDSIILATAMAEGWLLVTRNTRDFEEQEGLIRIPYRL